MNRIEYMRRLAALLQDVPAEERVATMQYYNDYFDDAGEENESKVIEELGSPEQVAAEMKAGLGRQTKDSGEFRETGYTDPQFEKKEVPGRYQGADRQSRESAYSDSAYTKNENRGAYAGRQAADNQEYYEPDGSRETKREPWTSGGLKLALIILIVLMAAPVLIPLAFAAVCCIFAFGIAGFAVFIALAAVAAALAFAGLALFIKGMLMTISNPAAALAVMGAGMILGVIGTIATVAAVRLCMIVLPGLFRFTVDLCRRPFQKRKKVV